MIQITPQMRILVAIEAIDFRKGLDSLVRLCLDRFAADPFSGCVVVFRNRRGTALRLLTYDGQGLWLATSDCPAGNFAGGPRARARPPRWRRISSSG
jgi:transposase